MTLFMATDTWADPTAHVVPGGLAIIPLGKSVETPKLLFNKHPLLVQKINGEWQALVGIPLSQQIGPANVIMSNISIPLTIEPYTYPEQHLTVKKNQVNPSAEELARIKKETAQMNKIYSSYTPARSFNGMIWPVHGRKSSAFGLRRFFNGEERSPHSGYDIAAPIGTPVKAPAAGKVVLTGNFFFNGKSVFIDHGQGLITMLCHLDSIAVKEGTDLKAGTLIGTVGTTGRSTGPHLHWTTSLNNARIDPTLLLAAGQPKTPDAPKP